MLPNIETQLVRIADSLERLVKLLGPVQESTGTGFRAGYDSPAGAETDDSSVELTDELRGFVADHLSTQLGRPLSEAELAEVYLPDAPLEGQIIHRRGSRTESDPDEGGR
jgi:hypothetical protein